jgi:hypothetical protein
MLAYAQLFIRFSQLLPPSLRSQQGYKMTHAGKKLHPGRHIKPGVAPPIFFLFHPSNTSYFIPNRAESANFSLPPLFTKPILAA